VRVAGRGARAGQHRTRLERGSAGSRKRTQHKGTLPVAGNTTQPARYLGSRQMQPRRAARAAVGPRVRGHLEDGRQHLRTLGGGGGGPGRPAPPRATPPACCPKPGGGGGGGSPRRVLWMQTWSQDLLTGAPELRTCWPSRTAPPAPWSAVARLTLTQRPRPGRRSNGRSGRLEALVGDRCGPEQGFSPVHSGNCTHGHASFRVPSVIVMFWKDSIH